MNGTNFIEKNLRLCAFLCALFLLSFSFGGAQDLPKEIRGYKVQRAKISVVNKTESSATEDRAAVSVKIGEPELIKIDKNFDAKDSTKSFEQRLTETLDALKSDVLAEAFDDYVKIV